MSTTTTSAPRGDTPTPNEGMLPAPEAGAEIYLRVQADPRFQEIRRGYRRFVFPMTAAFLLWYLTYVVASTFARDLMSYRIAGACNVALAFGLAQFASTFVITWLYARNAARGRDRQALDLRWETQEMFR